MRISRLLKAATALHTIQSDKYDPDTLILQLEADSDNKLTGIVSFFYSADSTEAAKRRSSQVQSALKQEKPGDLLQKPVVAEALLPFVQIGKKTRGDENEDDEPYVARAYGVIAHCILQSVRFDSDTTANGFLCKNGMVALKLKNFELPNEGWERSWDGSGRNVPCLLSLRVLEKIQMSSPPIMASLTEEDQEDLEAALEDGDIEEILDQAAAEKVGQQLEAIEFVQEQMSEKEKAVGKLRDREKKLKRLQKGNDDALEGFDDPDAKKCEAALKKELEDLAAKKQEAKQDAAKAKDELEKLKQSAPQDDTLKVVDGELRPIAMELERLVTEESAIIEKPTVQDTQVHSENASHAEAQQASRPPPDDKVTATAAQPVQEVQALAGKKRSRDDADPECDVPAKKSKPTPAPSASQIAGAKHSRDESEPDTPNKKARSAHEPLKETPSDLAITRERAEAVVPPASAVSDNRPRHIIKLKKTSVARPAATNGEDDVSAHPHIKQGESAVQPGHSTSTIANSTSSISKLSLPDHAVQSVQPSMSAVAPTEIRGEKPQQTAQKKPEDQGKQAQLPTPATSISQGSTPTPPSPEKFAAPSASQPSELDREITRYLNDNAEKLATIPKLKGLLKEWGYKVPQGSTPVSSMKKEELLAVVRSAMAERRRKNQLAHEALRRNAAGPAISQSYSGLKYTRAA